MRALTLDSGAIILPMKTGLRVYSTQGTVELRSKNLAGVHEILQKRLTGRYTEKALLSAVPLAQRMTVRRYLRALRDAGAIQTGKNGAVRYSRQGKGAARGRLLTRASEADDDDQHRGSQQASVQYVTCREFSSLLVQKGQTRAAAKWQVYVLTDDSWTVESGSGGADQQAFYSRWLLSGKFSSSEKPKIDVFQIDKNTGALTRKATLAGKRLAVNREVPKALELMRATDIEQAPLAICQANSMLCPRELRRFGVDYDRVADEVLRDILMCMSVESTDAIRQIQWRRAAIAKDMVVEPTLPQVVRVDECLVAASLGELRLRVLEHFMGQTQRTPVHAEWCDLLQPWSSPDLDYLAQVLSQRHSCLEAQVTTRADGLYQCSHGDLCTTSLLKHKALRDLMILLTWRTYYGHCDHAAYRPAHACDYSLFANPLQLRTLFCCTAEQLGGEIAEKYLIFAKISCWGKNVWLGMLDG